MRVAKGAQVVSLARAPKENDAVENESVPQSLENQESVENNVYLETSNGQDSGE